MNNSFSSQALIDKLSRLNSTQQSIESLSKWCIYYQNKARQIVETWEKMFGSSAKEKRISFLYLANDILQNSRREGSEFVNEFWRLLPGALKSVIESGDDHGKTVVARLVTIWDERRVFGSRGRDLKNKLLGDESTSLFERNGKNSQPFKIAKEDAETIKFKLAVGGTAEKIVTAFQSVLDENVDATVDRCNAVINSVKQSEIDVEDACAQGNQQVSSALRSEIHEKETTLKRCIKQIEGIEATKAALISQLKVALQEQELKLEITSNQLQVVRGELERVRKMRKLQASTSGQVMDTLPVDSATTDYKLPNYVCNFQPQQSCQPITSFISCSSSAEEHTKQLASATSQSMITRSLNTATDYNLPTLVPNAQPQKSSRPIPSFISTFPTTDEQHKKPLTSVSGQIMNALPIYTAAADHKLPNNVPNVQPQQSSQPVTSLINSLPTADEQHKKTAAAVAAKLAASTSSQQILNSVLSTFVAEEAASKNGSPKPESFTNGSPAFPVVKRTKVEKPMVSSEIKNSCLDPAGQQQMPSVSPVPSQASTSYQPMAQVSPRPQPPFPPSPPLPPPTPQHAQTRGMIGGVVPFGYGNTLPPPVQSHVPMGLTRAGGPPTTALQPPGLPVPQLSQQQQQAVATGFNQSPGMNFFGRTAATPVPQQ